MSGEGLSAEERVELFARGVIQHHIVEAVERIVARRESEAAEKALAAVERVRAVAEGWKAIPKPQTGWNSGLSATEAGNRLGAWNVRRMHADEILAALTPSAPTEEER